MHQFSDSDTPDSDDGRRFKTANTRPKKDSSHSSSHRTIYSRYKSRSPSPRRRSHQERRRKSRSRSRGRYDRDKRYSDESSRRKEESKNYSKYNDHREDRKIKSENNSSKEKNTSRSKRKDESFVKLEKDLNDSVEKKNKKVKDNCDNFGPSLPHCLAKHEDKPKESSKDAESYGPMLPPTLIDQSKDETNNKEICDNLPISASNTQVVIGPSLPPNKLIEEKVESSGERVIGPDLPHHLREQLIKASEFIAEENEDEDVIGPLPPEMMQTKAHIELEERALQIKINNLSGGAEVKKREEWMIELPAVRSAGLGLGPRQFKANAGPDMSDRSSWTDTPEDKLRKQVGGPTKEVDLKKEAEQREVRKRDEEQEKIIKKHKKRTKREEKSLLEMHQLKMQDKKETEKEVERRPFSREIDLKVNHFDEAQKKAILKKAQLLDDRFSSGQAKYL